MDESGIELIHLSNPHADPWAHQDTEIEPSNFEPASPAGCPRVPRADSGKDAWLFLAACFVLEALIWGFPFTFGIFQDYYSKHGPFKEQANIAVIGTCATVSLIISKLKLYAEICLLDMIVTNDSII
jgi:hypothetical protein